MKRYLLAATMSMVLLATVSATALARDRGDHDHGRGDRIERVHHHRFRAEHHRDRIKRFAPVQGASPQAAGTVKSFHNQILTIQLNDGSTVTGAIRPSTEVECAMRNSQVQTDDRGSSGGGERRGDQGDRGDDRGDRGDDNGDRQNAGDCLTALGMPGTSVHDATLALTSAGALWTRVDLDS